MNNIKYIIIHHTGGSDSNHLLDTSNQTFKIVDDYHKSLGWKGIGYHYFIEKTGKLTQGRKDNEEGAHTKGKNIESLGICLAGNFDVTLPTKEQIDTLTTLLRAKIDQYGVKLKNVVPHRTFANKTCFGSKLSDDWARNLVNGDQVEIIIKVNKSDKERFLNILNIIKAFIKVDY